MEIKVYQTINIDEKNIAADIITWFEDALSDRLPFESYVADLDAKIYNEIFDKVMAELQKYKREESEEN